jgi:hypothetical protein
LDDEDDALFALDTCRGKENATITGNQVEAAGKDLGVNFGLIMTVSV